MPQDGVLGRRRKRDEQLASADGSEASSDIGTGSFVASDGGGIAVANMLNPRVTIVDAETIAASSESGPMLSAESTNNNSTNNQQQQTDSNNDDDDEV